MAAACLAARLAARFKTVFSSGFLLERDFLELTSRSGKRRSLKATVRNREL
jgi:hypothetical protein